MDQGPPRVGGAGATPLSWKERIVSITKDEVVDVIKTIYDPEIPVNIYDLGLVYDIDVDGDEVNVVMTLTSPSCPSAKEIPLSIEQRVVSKLEAKKCLVHIIWTPPWGPHLISAEGKKLLGMEEGESDAAPGVPASGTDASASEPPAPEGTV